MDGWVMKLEGGVLVQRHQSHVGNSTFHHLAQLVDSYGVEEEGVVGKQWGSRLIKRKKGKRRRQRATKADDEKKKEDWLFLLVCAATDLIRWVGD
jgi:hypothetical protein